MSLRRVGGLAAVALATLLWISCGDIYRPVVIPTTLTPPNPANFHAVFAINANGALNFGTAMQIDVSGDSEIGVDNMGVNPTHAGILPNNSRIFVASSGGTSCPPAADTITAFTPAFDSTTATGLGAPVTFSLPSVGTSQSSGIANISEASDVVTVTLAGALSNARVGTPIEVSGVPGASGVSPYNGCFPIVAVSGTTIQYMNPTAGLTPASGGIATVPAYCPYLPDFVATSQNSAVYVANYGSESGLNCGLPNTDSVAQLSPVTQTITNIVYLAAGSHPVAMAETPNALNLYVLNQGNNTVLDLSPIDLTTLATISVGNMPVWAAVRPDGLRLYIITHDGQLYTIRTDTNAIVSKQSVGGPGANYVLYDTSRNRLYVTNPSAGAVYIFSAATDPPTPMGSATGALSIPAPPPCAAGVCGPVMPVSVAALPDSSRFYVASYVTAASGSPCPDPNVTAAGCVIPQVTVFDAGNFSMNGQAVVKTTVFPLLPPVINPASGIQPFAAAPAAFCAPVTPYATASARFRMSAAAAVDSSRVYASMCDGGWVAIVNTTTNTITTGGNNSSDVLVTDLAAPFGVGAPGPNGEPPLQNPVLLLTGQ
ncbi:MAG: YncE family protein [Candidatus Sulfotelmatobacter sp.]